MTYGADAIERFPTALGSSLAANASTTILSSNLQLNAVPEKILVFCRENTANLTYTSSDVALALTGISINFNNQSGLLASATQLDLFQMSKSNGLQDDWELFSGLSGSLGTVVGTSGSFLMLRFGKDISLPSDCWPGKVGAFNLQLTATVKNVNQSASITNPTLYIITFTNQKLQISEGGAVQTILGISESEKSQATEYVQFSKVKKHYGGSFGDFMSKVGSFLKPVLDGLRSTKAVSTIASLIPHPAAQLVGQAASRMGFGGIQGGIQGGFSAGEMPSEDDLNCALGGRGISKAELKRRLKQL
jgi:hypothetical protein